MNAGTKALWVVVLVFGLGGILATGNLFFGVLALIAGIVGTAFFGGKS